ncbi:Uncharacterised protein [Mycobacteroides abscessus subsp. abscessus]|uniref:hypothetical protein n=1 Tax=Mycobacteroides abscessus TaxID=36809 RepID=UPI0009259166|nr:hypothetical protein [Mycobacteroides abscessus]SIH35787.1 Uncharacterised protein [Mycobacteroides abscessus subsp. abscessus]
MENASIEEFSNLRANSFNGELRELHGGYSYTIVDNHTAHTAFNTRPEMDEWLTERGLELEAPLPAEQGEGSSVPVKGSYRVVTDRDAERFATLTPLLETIVWSNGDRVRAKITEEAGIRTVHVMNPNYR